MVEPTRFGYAGERQNRSGGLPDATNEILGNLRTCSGSAGWRQYARSLRSPLPDGAAERAKMAPSCRTGASGKGSEGLDMTRSSSRPATTAVCAQQPFTAWLARGYNPTQANVTLPWTPLRRAGPARVERRSVS